MRPGNLERTTNGEGRVRARVRAGLGARPSNVAFEFFAFVLLSEKFVKDGVGG